MNKMFSKIISVVLILTFLVSTLAVFISAEDGETEKEPIILNDGSISGYDVTLYYNRNYEEGWQYNNGFETTRVNNNNFFVDYEETVDFGYNYFMRLEAANSGVGKIRMSHYNDNIMTGGYVVEFSIKADDASNFGTVMEFTTAKQEHTIPILAIKNGEVIVTPNGSVTNEPVNCTHPDADGDGNCDYNKPSMGGSLGKISNEWLDVALIFDFDEVNLTCYVLYGENYQYSKYVSIPYQQGKEGAGGIRYLDIGFGAAAAAEIADRVGMSFCIDNLKAYSGAKGIATIDQSVHGYGQKINTIADKVVDIKTSDGVKGKNQLVEESLALKLGVNYALARGEKIVMDTKGGYGAPKLVMGEDGQRHPMIPLKLVLDFIGYPYYLHPDGESYDITTGMSATYIAAGRKSATVNGERVDLTVAPGYITDADGNQYLTIAAEDVAAIFPGWLSLYDDMGLVMIYEDVTPENNNDAPILTRENDLARMLEIMKKFVFGFDMSANAATYNGIGTDVYNAVKENTESFTHPYIMANKDTFDSLRAAYTGSASELKGYLETIIADADSFYNENAIVSSGSYAGVSDSLNLKNVYADGQNPVLETDTIIADTTDGYDPFGRLDIIVNATEILPTLAFAYQVTQNEKYARLAYDIQAALATWAHWGPAYFINCAMATTNYAIAYDWLYNAYMTLFGAENVAKLSYAIYELGVHDGYVSSMGMTVEHARELGDNSQYNTKGDHWNAVCSSGMIIGALSVLDYVTTQAQYYNEAIYLIGNNFVNLSSLGLDQYAPDGSYIESVKHWELSTGSFIKMVMALTTAAGDDYGFMDTWGMDRTCYFAAQIESSDGFIWNYHNGGADGVTSGALVGANTDIFNFVGLFYGDSTLLSVRKAQLQDGKKISILDLLAYPGEEIEAKKELPLSYELESLDGYVVRDGWHKGAMYTGIMAGSNGCAGGQIDSGNFIYHNNGVVWFMDLGSENYDVFQYYSSNKFKYYREGAEGNNVIFIDNEPDLMYGQYSSTGGYMQATYSTEYGSYAIINNTNAYNGKTSLAQRGLLVKDGGKTVVIQDELYFVDVEEMIWLAHTAQDVQVSDDGLTAYLVSKTSSIIRVTLVSAIKELMFETENAYQRSLDATYNRNDSVNNGGQPEYSRDGITRLIIKAPPILNIEMAVVVEEVSEIGDSKPVNYSFQSMVRWDIDSPPKTDGSDNVERHPAASLLYLRTGAGDANDLVKRKTALNKKLADFYGILSRLSYTVKAIGGRDAIVSGSGSNAALIDYYKQFQNCLEDYNDYRETVNKNIANLRTTARVLAGLIVE